MDWINLGLLALGLVFGFLLVGIEAWLRGSRFKKYFVEALVDTNKSPVRNVLTAGIVMILALWMNASSGSSLGRGVVLGCGIKLYIDYLQDRNKSRWFWIFATKFEARQQKMFAWIWGISLGLVMLGLL